MDDMGTPSITTILNTLVDVRGQGDCWLWTGALDRSGYGVIYVDARPRRAHRVVWAALVGPIDPHDDLHHHCPVRRCVNPAHLSTVPAVDHIRRYHGKRGRQGMLPLRDGRPSSSTPDVAAVLRDVAVETGIPTADLLGTDRSRSVVVARQTAMHRLRQLGYSLGDIGAVFDRHHTTVLHGIRRCAAAL